MPRALSSTELALRYLLKKWMIIFWLWIKTPELEVIYHRAGCLTSSSSRSHLLTWVIKLIRFSPLMYRWFWPWLAVELSETLCWHLLRFPSLTFKSFPYPGSILPVSLCLLSSEHACILLPLVPAVPAAWITLLSSLLCFHPLSISCLKS